MILPRSLRSICFTVAALSLIATCSQSATAQETKQAAVQEGGSLPNSPPIQSLYGLSDFAVLKNGKTHAIIRNDGLHKSVGYNENGFRWNRYPDSFFDGRPTTYERIFADRDSDDGYLLFTRYRTSGNEPRFVFYNKGGQKQWGMITKSFDDGSYHQAKNGAVFIYSRNGLIIRIRNGRIENYRIPPAAELVYVQKGKLQPIRCAESSEGVVVFYSMVDPGLKKKAIDSLIVFDDKQPGDKRWQRISLSGKQTGPGWFRSPRQFCLVNARQWLSVNLDSKQVTVKPHAGFQTDKNVALKPVDVLMDPQGKPHIAWRHFYRSAFRYDVAPQKDGKFHRLATPSFDESGSLSWKDESVTMDYGLYRPRLHVADAKGNWWIASSGALQCRTVDGQWKEFGFRHGYPEDFSGNQIQFDNQNRLWLSNTKKSGARPLLIHVDRLAASEVTLSERWQKIQQVVPTWRSNAEGNIACLDRADRLHAWTKDGLQVLPLPATSAKNDEGAMESLSFDFRNDRLKQDGEKWLWYQVRTQTKHVYANNKWTKESLVEGDLKKENFPAQALSCPGTRESCPVADRTRMNRYSDPVRRVRTADRVAVASPDGRWHTYAWQNEIERELLFRTVYADNNGRLFVPRDVYYKPSASLIWYQPLKAELDFGASELGEVSEVNAAVKLNWGLKPIGSKETMSIDNGVYRWKVDLGDWSRWLPLQTDPVIYALPKQGEHSLQIEANFPGVYLSKIEATFGFKTTYNLQEQLDTHFKQLDSESFDERQQALNEIAKFGYGIVPQLNEIKESGTTEARMNAIKLLNRIEAEMPKDAQHSKK